MDITSVKMEVDEQEDNVYRISLSFKHKRRDGLMNTSVFYARNIGELIRGIKYNIDNNLFPESYK